MEDQLTRFDFVLGSVKVLEFETDGAPRILCTASSDEVDLGVDRFALSALNTMAAEFPGMTIFLNHKYVVPEDVFGVVASATVVERNGHRDLDLEVAVDTNNQRAITAYKQIQSGAKLGVSVGVLVTDADYANEKVDGKKVLNIKGVKTLEASIVGIPANRRSWVQGALKAASMFFDAGQHEALEKLAASDGSTVMTIDNEIVNGEETVEVSGMAPVSEVLPVPDASTETSVAEKDGVTVVVVTVDDDDEEDDGSNPDDPAVITPPGGQHAERARVLASLRAKYADQNRKWYSIEETESAAVDDPAEAKPDTVAEIMIYDAIGDGLGAKAFVQAISEIKASRINVRLNSPGGVIDDGIAIRNALARHPADVYTYVDGLAASMASVIALVGKEVVMEPDSMMMIHEPWGCQMGDSAAMAREARILDKYATNIAGAYARKAGGTRDEWRDVMRDEGWYTPEEAVDAGLADRVGDNANSENAQKSFDSQIFTLFKNAPESAKRFFKASIEPDVTSSIEPVKISSVEDLADLTAGITSLTNALKGAQEENDALRKSVSDKEAEAIVKDDELTDAKSVIAEVMVHVNKILDMPMSRKTGEAFADGIGEIATKYPWLDERIVSQMARKALPQS